METGEAYMHYTESCWIEARYYGIVKNASGEEETVPLGEGLAMDFEEARRLGEALLSYQDVVIGSISDYKLSREEALTLIAVTAVEERLTE